MQHSFPARIKPGGGGVVFAQYLISAARGLTFSTMKTGDRQISVPYH